MLYEQIYLVFELVKRLSIQNSLLQLHKYFFNLVLIDFLIVFKGALLRLIGILGRILVSRGLIQGLSLG